MSLMGGIPLIRTCVRARGGFGKLNLNFMGVVGVKERQRRHCGVEMYISDMCMWSMYLIECIWAFPRKDARTYLHMYMFVWGRVSTVMFMTTDVGVSDVQDE